MVGSEFSYTTRRILREFVFVSASSLQFFTTMVRSLLDSDFAVIPQFLVFRSFFNQTLVEIER